MTDSEVIMSIENVSYRYPGTKENVLHDVSLEVHRGEYVGIIGPNGAGKSTLCYLMNGIIPHALGGKLQGKVVSHGIDTKDSKTADLSQNVGMVFSDPAAQLTQRTVFEEVAFGPSNLGIPLDEIYKRVPEALKMVDLEGYEERAPYSLSGGQEQRLAAGSVLSMLPETLVLDEPTTNLDPIGTIEVFSTVRSLNKDYKMTVIIVEHEIELLAEYADRLIALQDGKIVIDGPIRDVLSEQELFDSMRVRLPQVTEASQILQRKYGFDISTIGKIPITMEEAVKFYEKLFSGGK